MKPFHKIILLNLLVIISCQNKHKDIKTMPDIIAKNHSYSNYDSIDIINLNLNLNVDFDKKILNGVANYQIDNHTKTNYIIFDIKNLKILKVRLNDSLDAAYSFSKEDEILGKALVIEINPYTHKVSIQYETTKLSEALMWLSPDQTADKKHPFLYTQSQAILARTWVPCMDAPAVKFTYTAQVKCEKPFTALMSSNLIKHDEKENIFYFNLDKPIPSYLLALAVGELNYVKLGENCGVYAEKSMIDKAAYEFEDLPKMISSAEKLYGKYEWGNYNLLVMPPSFPFGGMENPILTFATPSIITGDKSLVSLVAHELAHSWSGNLVTNRFWDDFWLNEGFTVYFEMRIMEQIYVKEYANMLHRINYDDLQRTLSEMMLEAPGDTKLKLNLKGRNPDDGVSDIAYVKGCLFLIMLENYYGRESLDEFLKKYFNHFKWKTITTEEFIDYLNAHLLIKKPMDSKIIQQWIYDIGLPKNCPVIESNEYNRVIEMATKFNKNGQLKSIDTSKFTTHHYLFLLRNLNSDSIKNNIQMLDSVYQFSNSSNAEILCEWFVLCIKSQYLKPMPQIEKFLTSVGRRKFLTPIYDALISTDNGKEIAEDIYDKAKASYHFVSRNTIEEMLKNK